MAGDGLRAPASITASVPLHFLKQIFPGGKSDSCESPITFLNWLHILLSIGSEGMKWHIRVGEAHGASWFTVTGSKTDPCPSTLSTSLKLSLGSMLSLMTLSIMDFRHCFISLPRKNEKKIELVKVVFNGRETHKSSVEKR